MRRMIVLTLLFVSKIGLQAGDCLTSRPPHREKMMLFNEFTLDREGRFFIDVDFDGVKEIVYVVDGDVTVHKFDGEKRVSNDVSLEVPYCMIRAHSCCYAHTAYTTFNYTERTVYAEAHYGGFEVEKRRFKKICDGWIEISPIKPQSILQTNLYPTFPVGWMYFGSYKVWKWSNYYNR